MPDRYTDFASLSRAESTGAFMIRVHDAGSDAVIVAPHGGGIEPGTSEIALAVAGTDLSYYLFEGLKPSGNADLHITSSRFDEPRCLALIGAARFVVAIHGEGSHSRAVFVGGGHADLQSALRASLEAAGFVVKRHTDPELQGLHPRNICNMGKGGAGAQLELGRGLRRELFQSMDRAGRTRPTPDLARFASALRRGLQQWGA